MSMASGLVVRYLRMRYGYGAILPKPPIGWCKYFPAPVWYKAWYLVCLRPMWVLDRYLYLRYEKEIVGATWIKS